MDDGRHARPVDDAAPRKSREESAATLSKGVTNAVSLDMPEEALADRTARTLYERLMPRQRIRAVAGLASVLLLGLFLLFAVWAGARFTRSYLRAATPARAKPSGQDLDDWARKPLVQHEEAYDSSS